MIRHYNTKAGVTLVEMLAAIAILALLMGGIYRVMSITASIADTSQQRTRTARSAWSMLQQISGELRSIPGSEGMGILRGVGSTLDLSDASGDAGADIASVFPAGNLPAHTLRFEAYVPSPPGYAKLEYGLHRDEQGRPSGVYRRLALPGEEIEDTPGEIVSTQAVAVEFQYKNEHGEWLSQWEPTDLPLAVKIRVWMLTPLRGNRIEVSEFRTVVNLPAAKEIVL